MSEFNCSVDVPLAITEDFGDFQCSEDIDNSNTVSNNPTEQLDNKAFVETNGSTLTDNSFSESLEDLVNTFDEKITNCFRNYDENVSNLAPVQVRSQEDIMNESQMWWTLTGNFGNILPIDWNKTYARKLHLPTLNINESLNGGRNLSNNINELFDPNCDEEELAKDLDMHSLILSSLQQEPIFTAEQVLEEIDEIMMSESTSSVTTSETNSSDKSPTSCDERKERQSMAALLYEEKLKTYSTVQLNELYMDLERMIQHNSETLIHELALRDELEFEKELKNSFISVLLSVQNKRRQHHLDRKRGRTAEPKYLTTVIPYNTGSGPPTVATLQMLIKILRAINEDSPTVPTLLTDYILKVICPTT
ncbi:fasciculation and elongation protein zeta-2-like [Oppia nitens]|uniref:fasciculation and elongation protein zeta-2-like n=1 Tax=Oppia nitens TaxID=1686743 RepID=UPI0023DCCDB8|nr:fasciculation and elongation protein zeta-2-like [Oppia nitens]